MLDLSIDSRIFINTTLDAALQELDMIFNTENTELIGYPEYGTNFEQFLWQSNPSPEALKKYIEEKINDSFFLSSLQTDISVEILTGDYRSIYHVKITVYDENNKQGIREYQLR